MVFRDEFAAEVKKPLSSRIRAYHPDDRQAVFRIAADTAFFGAPVEAFLDDRRLFCDAFTRYYTDYEAENGLIAEARRDGEDWETAGFLLGCLDTRRQQRRWLRWILPSTVGRMLTGRYRLGKRTWGYALRLVAAHLRGETPVCDVDLYPAHLHINLVEGWRGLGLGRGLMETYLARLRALSVPGVHLHTTSLNQVACRLYEGMGFELLNRRWTGAWGGITQQPVENLCYGLRL